jgi:glutamine synthetase
MTPGFSATGEYDLIPIFSSLRLYHRENYAVVQAEFRQKLGAEVPIDPRTALRHVNERGAARGVTFLLGFEIEVVFMNMNAAGIYEPITNSPGHGWASAHALRDTEIMGAIEEIHDTFKKADIELLMIHPESAPGQYEFILGALPPLEAVDTLVVAKDIIAAVGHKRGFRATCVPKPVPMACGTGAHVHVSCHPESHEVSFYAGILEHLPSIAAFTLSGEDSYKRTQDSIWAGGRWIAWGTQNRETPLRKIEGSHWELKCMDGLANPYLALAVILAAGLLGIEGQEHLRWKDCQEDPAKLKQSERLRLGIVEKLPKSLGEALEELSADEELMDVLGRELVEKYIALKRFEDEFLKSMDVEKRTAWLLERY